MLHCAEMSRRKPSDGGLLSPIVSPMSFLLQRIIITDGDNVRSVA